MKIITGKTASDFVSQKGVVVSTYLDKDIWNPAAIVCASYKNPFFDILLKRSNWPGPCGKLFATATQPWSLRQKKSIGILERRTCVILKVKKNTSNKVPHPKNSTDSLGAVQEKENK